MDWLKILGPTLLIITGGGGIVTWIIQNRIQKLQKLQEKLRDERIEKYNEIVKPIILIYSKFGGGQDKAVKLLQSYDYRKSSFELNFWGSDRVINAFNEMMQFTYRQEREGKIEDSNRILLTLLGKFLLEIRKDIGNSKTKLKSVDMLRSMISDIDNYKI